MGIACKRSNAERRLNYEFDAMTSTIIGGTSFSGGIGNPFGTVIGSFIVGFLNNIMNLVSIDSYLQQVVRGFIIGVAVIWDIYSKKKKTYKKRLNIRPKRLMDKTLLF